MKDLGNDSRLLELLRSYSKAKDAEGAARVHRIAVEEQVIRYCGFALDEGSESYKTETGQGRATVNIKQPVARNCVMDLVASVKKVLPRGVFNGVFRTKYDISKKDLDNLRDSNHDLYLEAVRAIKMKPGKVGVTLNSLEVLGGD